MPNTRQVISIGRLHHGAQQLQPMENQKKRYFIEFCKRTLPKDKKESLTNHVKTFSTLLLHNINEEEMRCSYAADIFKFGSTDRVC